MRRDIFKNQNGRGVPRSYRIGTMLQDVNSGVARFSPNRNVAVMSGRWLLS